MKQIGHEMKMPERCRQTAPASLFGVGPTAARTRLLSDGYPQTATTRLGNVAKKSTQG